MNANVPAGRESLEQFLRPEAMLTPGVAGALAMAIANALGTSFGAPRAYTALVLSFLFGLLVLVVDRGILAKIIYYLLNSLVIFCVAAGSNGIGIATSNGTATRALLVTSAFAQTDLLAEYKKLSDEFDAKLHAIDDARKRGASSEEISKLTSDLAELDKRRQEALNNTLKGFGQGNVQAAPNSIFKEDSFFQQWKF